jgi:hypothetical protein
LLQKASDTLETSYPEPPEFVAQGDRVLVIGFAKGKIKATNKMFEDHWVFDITVRDGKLTNIREYIDTQALARASEMDASRRPWPIDTDSIRHLTIDTRRKTFLEIEHAGYLVGDEIVCR